MYQAIVAGFAAFLAASPPSAAGLKLRCVLEGHSSSVESVAFSPDGRLLASGGGECSVRIWDVATCKNSVTIPFEDPELLVSLAFNPNGKAVAAAGSCPAIIKGWDVATRRATIRIEPRDESAGSIAFHPDGNSFATGWGMPDSVRLWDVASGKPTAKIVGGARRPVAFSADGKTLATGGERGEIMLWDLATQKTSGVLPGRAGLLDRLDYLAFAPNGKTLIAVGRTLPERMEATRHWVDLWRISDRKIVFTIDGECAAFNPSGKIIATGDAGGTIKLWDAATGKNVAKTDGHTGDVNSVAFSPDGKILASGSDDQTIKLWDVKTDD